jgi:hypothetical protein
MRYYHLEKTIVKWQGQFGGSPSRRKFELRSSNFEVSSYVSFAGSSLGTMMWMTSNAKRYALPATKNTAT